MAFLESRFRMSMNAPAQVDQTVAEFAVDLFCDQFLRRTMPVI
jgi:hypothetical protein